MISPINSTASVVNTEEMAMKTMNGLSSPPGSDAVQLEAGSLAISKLDKSAGSKQSQRSDGEKTNQRKDTTKEEVRKVLVEDGEITINVYDSSGKLLRKTPPGYLPLGEQGFDVTI